MAATNSTTRTARVKFDGDARGLASAARRAERAMDGVSGKSEIMTGAFRSIGAAAIKLGPLLAAGLAALPAIAAIAATGIVLAFGGILAGIGLAAAAQSRAVKREFAGLKRHVLTRLKDISTPFRATLSTIAQTARDTFDSFEPALARAFRRIAPNLSGFVRQFGSAFTQLRRAFGPLTGAFNAILRQLGPQMRPLFRDIAGSLIDLAGVVKRNKTEFSLFIMGLLRLIPRTISIVAKLAAGFGAFIRKVGPWAAMFIAGYRRMLAAVRVWANVLMGAFGLIVTGAAKAFGWVPGVGDKLQRAKREFDGFRDGVRRVFNDAESTLRGWENNLRRLPKTIKLRGEINDLRSKIQTAKARLRTVPRSRQAEIRGRIRDLQAKVRQANRELNGLPSYKSIQIAVNVTRSIASVFTGGLAGLGRRAGGGPVSAGRSYLVGENGPEIVTMGGAGNVTPNHAIGGSTEVRVFIGDTELRGMVRSEISEHDRGIKRRALAGTGASR